MTQNRVQDWPERLDATITAARDQPFKWGQNDCVTVAAAAFQAVTGTDPISHIRGQWRDALSALRMAERLGGSTVEAAIGAVCDQLGMQRVPPALAQRGDIGLALGADGRLVTAVCVGASWLAPGPDGLVALKLCSVRSAWHIGDPIELARRCVEITEPAGSDPMCAMPPAILGVAGAAAGAYLGSAAAVAITGATAVTVGGVALSATAVALGTTLGMVTMAVVSTATMLAFSYLGQALFPAETPKTSSQANRSDRSQSFIQPITSHKVIYGRIRVGGPIVYFLARPAITPDPDATPPVVAEYDNYHEKDSDYKDFLHLVIVLASHKCYSIEDVYLEDTKVGTIGSDGYAQGSSWQAKNRSRVRVHKRLGESNQTAFDELISVSNYPVTASIVFSVYDGDHIENDSWIEIDGQRVLLTRSPGTTGDHVITTTGGVIKGTITGSVIKVWISDDLSDSLENIEFVLQYIADNNLNSHIAKLSYKYKDDIGQRYKGRIRLTYNGDERIIIRVSSDPKSFAQSPKIIQKRKWTTDHKLLGRTCIHIRLEYDEEVFPNGIPNVSAVVKGRLVYDPRTGLTAWSENPALCILDYLCAPFGLSCDRATEIDIDSFIAAANDCDGPPMATLTGTEKPYTCNGVIDLASSPQDIIEGLLTSCAGRLVFTGGKWRLRVGVWHTGTFVALGESQLRAPVVVQPARSRRELINTVRGSFVSPAHKWQTIDYPVVTNSAYKTADGTELTLTLDLPFTNSDSMAQRISRIALGQSRNQMSVQYQANLSGLQVCAGDTVSLTLPRFGISSETFVVTCWKLSEDMGVDLSLVQDNANVYSFSVSNLKAMTYIGEIE